MGRKRKRVVHIPKKRLPKYFSCPKCGKETVEVKISRDAACATAGCSSCGLNETFPIKIAQTEVDIYCMLTDKVFSSPKKNLVSNTQEDN
jgi:transcription elongation factor Elf1